MIYGGREEFDERLLRSEYAAVGLYYRQANRCRPGACPATYRFHVAPGLTFTIESYLGEPVALDRLSPAGAFGYGEEAGRFFRAMHDVPPEIVGFGEPLWRGDESGALVGEGGRPLEAIWREERAAFRERFERPGASDLPFDRAGVERKLSAALERRAFDREAVALVNGDVTPENLLARGERFGGLIDPVPLLHNGTRYAACFVFCYRFLLPALADAPRYARHRFDRHAPTLAAIADGYVEGYAGRATPSAGTSKPSASSGPWASRTRTCARSGRSRRRNAGCAPGARRRSRCAWGDA